MKTSLQHLLISFIGSLLALACFVGIVQLIYNDDDETSAPFNQEKQLIEAQETIQCFRLMLDDIPDDFSLMLLSNRIIGKRLSSILINMVIPMIPKPIIMSRS